VASRNIMCVLIGVSRMCRPKQAMSTSWWG